MDDSPACEAHTLSARAAKPSDIGPLVRLFDAAGASKTLHVAPPGQSGQQLAQQIDDSKTFSVLVIEQHAGVLAAAIALEQSAATATLCLLAVAPQRTDEGLGTRMLSIAELLCRANSVPRLQVDLGGSCRTLAVLQELRDLGFRECAGVLSKELAPAAPAAWTAAV